MQNEFKTLKALPVIKSFISYLKNRDYVNIEYILDEGVYYVQNRRTLQLFKTNKDGFIKWICNKIKSSRSKDLFYWGIGIKATAKNQLIITLNNGFFPYMPHKSKEITLGLLVTVKNNKISKIQPHKVEANLHLIEADSYLKSLWNTVYQNKKYSYYKTIDMQYNRIPLDPYSE